jgi:hypothetical protein
MNYIKVCKIKKTLGRSDHCSVCPLVCPTIEGVFSIQYAPDPCEPLEPAVLASMTIQILTDGRSGGSARTRHLLALPRYSELAAFFLIVVFVVLLVGVIIKGRLCMSEICRASKDE